MSEFRITFDVAGLPPDQWALDATSFPELSKTVRLMAEQAHRDWVTYASGAPLPNGRVLHKRTAAYANSITFRQLGPLSAEVYSDLPYARTIEDGAPARDLHDILGHSLKVRLTKSGKRYLIIPFRSYQPNAVIGTPMPQAIHDWWRGVPRAESSHVTRMGWRNSGTGAIAFHNRTDSQYREVRGQVVQVSQREYSWGRKLTAGNIAGMGLGKDIARRFAGMYRFDNSEKPGTQSQFIHFRVLMEGSSGWRVPARPGLHVAQTVANQLRPIAEEAFGKAMEIDVRALLRSQT